jgi:hypothetical protein
LHRKDASGFPVEYVRTPIRGKGELVGTVADGILLLTHWSSLLTLALTYGRWRAMPVCPAVARRQLLGRKPRSHTWLCSTIALPLELTCGDAGDAPHPGGKWLTEENMVRGNLARVDARPDDL